MNPATGSHFWLCEDRRSPRQWLGYFVTVAVCLVLLWAVSPRGLWR